LGKRKSQNSITPDTPLLGSAVTYSKERVSCNRTKKKETNKRGLLG